MPKAKAKVTCRPHKEWLEEEIIIILEEVITLLLTDPTFFHTSYHIAAKRLPKATLCDWCNRSPTIKSIHNEMRELAESKISNELIKAKGGVNTTGAIFILKTKHGYVEEQYRKTDTTVSQETIEVGFEDDDADKD